MEEELKSRDPFKNVLLKELIINKKVRSDISRQFANKLKNKAYIINIMRLMGRKYL